jgi:phage protein D
VTRQAQNRIASSISVTYPDFPSFNVPVYNFQLHQEVGKHDIVELRYAQGRDFYFKALKTGTPVSIVWNNDKTKGKLFGYVHSISTQSSQALENFVVIKVVGASFPLKEGGSKIWVNKTASEIATEIAKKFKLKPVVTNHPLRFSQQSLSGHTYWEKLQELASKVGYVCQVTGTELHFHPLDSMINKHMSAIPILAINNNYTTAHNNPHSQTLDLFVPTVGDHFDTNLNSRNTKTINGIDPVTGRHYSSTSSATKTGKQLRKKTKDPLFSETLPTTNSGNKNASELIAKAKAELSRFSIEAKGNGQGDPRMAPYRTVHVSGTGQNSDGFWVIKKITHFITFDGRYSVEFTCMTDGTRGNKASSMRPTEAALIPTMDLSDEGTGATTRTSYTKLTAQAAMVSETDSGFNVTPRRWVNR